MLLLRFTHNVLTSGVNYAGNCYKRIMPNLFGQRLERLRLKFTDSISTLLASVMLSFIYLFIYLFIFIIFSEHMILRTFGS